MKQADEQEKQDRANRGIDDGRNDARTEMDSELRQEPARNEGAYDSHDEVADEAKAGPLDDLAREPAGSDTDNQYDEKIFARYVHVCVPAIGSPGGGYPGCHRSHARRRRLSKIDQMSRVYTTVPSLVGVKSFNGTGLCNFAQRKLSGTDKLSLWARQHQHQNGRDV